MLLGWSKKFRYDIYFLCARYVPRITSASCVPTSLIGLSSACKHRSDGCHSGLVFNYLNENCFGKKAIRAIIIQISSFNNVVTISDRWII